MFAAPPAAAEALVASFRRFVHTPAFRRGTSSHTHFPFPPAPRERRSLLHHRSSTHTQEEKDPCPT
jgi:hypothetical protein